MPTQLTSTLLAPLPKQTAFQVLQLLRWLHEGPKTLAELQHLFSKDPYIGKPLSDDAIRLYLNTLKAIGCNITRPSGKNSFRYTLEEHPFHRRLHAESSLLLEAFFKQVLTHFEQHNNWQGWLETLTMWHAFCQSQQLEALYANSLQQLGASDLRPYIPMLNTLQQAVNEKRWLRIVYPSWQASMRYWLFFPTHFRLRRGMLLVEGLRQPWRSTQGQRTQGQSTKEEAPETTSFRLDRLLEAHLSFDLPAALHRPQLAVVQVRMSAECWRQLHEALNAQQFLGLHLQEVSLEAPEAQTPEAQISCQPVWTLRLQYDDAFTLSQWLLGLGYPYRMLSQ